MPGLRAKANRAKESARLEEERGRPLPPLHSHLREDGGGVVQVLRGQKERGAKRLRVGEIRPFGVTEPSEPSGTWTAGAGIASNGSLGEKETGILKK